MLTAAELNTEAGHLLDCIADRVNHLTRDDADQVIDELIDRLNRPATREMILPDDVDLDAAMAERANHPSLTVAQRNSRGVFARCN